MSKRGTLQISLQPTSFEGLVQRLERLVNRLILGIIVAALVIGLALLMVGYHSSFWDHWEGIVFLFGCLAVGLLGIFLAANISRSGRKMP